MKKIYCLLYCIALLGCGTQEMIHAMDSGWAAMTQKEQKEVINNSRAYHKKHGKYPPINIDRLGIVAPPGRYEYLSALIHKVIYFLESFADTQRITPATTATKTKLIKITQEIRQLKNDGAAEIINVFPGAKESLLQIAIQREAYDLAKIFVLEYHADVATYHAALVTAVHKLSDQLHREHAYRGTLNMILFLLDHGADPMIKNSSGYTLLDQEYYQNRYGNQGFILKNILQRYVFAQMVKNMLISKKVEDSASMIPELAAIIGEYAVNSSHLDTNFELIAKVYPKLAEAITMHNSKKNGEDGKENARVFSLVNIIMREIKTQSKQNQSITKNAMVAFNNIASSLPLPFKKSKYAEQLSAIMQSYSMLLNRMPLLHALMHEIVFA